MKQNNKDLLNKALDALDNYFSDHETVDTHFGPQSTNNGYQLHEIFFFGQNVGIRAYILNRPLEKEDDIRGGDEVCFYYVQKESKLFPSEEYEAYCRGEDTELDLLNIFVPVIKQEKTVLYPLEEFMDIKACQYGFDGYSDLRESGMSLDLPEDLYDEYDEKFFFTEKKKREILAKLDEKNNIKPTFIR